jgi:transposase
MVSLIRWSRVAFDTALRRVGTLWSGTVSAIIDSVDTGEPWICVPSRFAVASLASHTNTQG